MKLLDVRKFLSFVLRHRPDSIGIDLDENGWIDLDALIPASRANGTPLTIELVQQAVDENDKQRFVIRDGRIRASQGHSIDVSLDLPQRDPPVSLYHGTASKALEAILASGLKRMKKQHVHLSLDIETALNVGQRHGRPVVLIIAAQSMHESGYVFYLSENNVWLVDAVPANYLEPVEAR